MTSLIEMLTGIFVNSFDMNRRVGFCQAGQDSSLDAQLAHFLIQLFLVGGMIWMQETLIADNVHRVMIIVIAIALRMLEGFTLLAKQLQLLAKYVLEIRKNYLVFSLILYTAVTFKVCESINVTLAVEKVKHVLCIRGVFGSGL